ncbi:MAG: NUDIX hydrolase [Candidatus Cloacimonetes bacterium]|mgnify:CR=1 FL=1|nr:NUDIX hydrolase [Candidatus Cloacimonadota bacterium]MDD2543365.1 NUDIX hydrolase [Candidatus Cloacimonadota bacterium]MDD2683542.1 NUDIX hydrolase [Candidatus Cloacimonadota bacterium]
MQELMTKLYSDVSYCQRCGGKMKLNVDYENKIRSVCDACGFVLYRNPIPAVAMVVLNDKHELLLVLRKYEPRAGMWALPSGYAEIFMSPEQNAIAELSEETGLIGEIDHRIDWFYGFSPIYYRVISLGFRMKVTGGELLAGDDAADARFFPLDALPEIAFAAHRHFINLETGLQLNTGVIE